MEGLLVQNGLIDKKDSGEKKKCDARRADVSGEMRKRSEM